MSEEFRDFGHLTPVERVTMRALEMVRDGKVDIPPAWRAVFDEIARRNPDLVALTGAIVRRTIEKTTN